MASPRLRVLHELVSFINGSKKYWLAPILLILLLAAAALSVAQSSVVAPFLYTLF